MKFTEYVDRMSQWHGFGSWFAKQLGVPPVRVSYWKLRRCAIPIWAWRRIEKITEGQVTILEILDEQCDLFHTTAQSRVSKLEESKPGHFPCRMVGGPVPDQGDSVPAEKERPAILPTAWSHGPKPRGPGRPRKVSIPELQRANTEPLSTDQRQGHSGALHSIGGMEMAKDTAKPQKLNGEQKKALAGAVSGPIWGAKKASNENVDGSPKTDELTKAETADEVKARLGIKKLEPRE